MQLSKEHFQYCRHALTLRYDFSKQKLVTTPIDDIGVYVKTGFFQLLSCRLWFYLMINTAAGSQIPLYPQDKVWGVSVATDATGTISVLIHS